MPVADIQKTKGEGSFAVNFFGNGYISRVRGDSFIDWIQQHSELKLISQSYSTSQGEVFHATTDLLEKNLNLSFIYSYATDVAIGTSKAVHNVVTEQHILINGWGGGNKELDALQSGELERMNDDNGVAMAEAIKLDLEGKEKQVPVVFSGDFKLLTSAITQEERVALERHAFRYSSTKK